MSCADPDALSDVEVLLAMMRPLQLEVRHLDLNDSRITAVTTRTVDQRSDQIQEKLIVKLAQTYGRGSTHSWQHVLDRPKRVDETQELWVDPVTSRRLDHGTSDEVVGSDKPESLLHDVARPMASEDRFQRPLCGAGLVGLELVEGKLDLPSVVVLQGQVHSGDLAAQQRGDEANGLEASHVVVDDAYQHADSLVNARSPHWSLDFLGQGSRSEGFNPGEVVRGLLAHTPDRAELDEGRHAGEKVASLCPQHAKEPRRVEASIQEDESSVREVSQQRERHRTLRCLPSTEDDVTESVGVNILKGDHLELRKRRATSRRLHTAEDLPVLLGVGHRELSAVERIDAEAVE